MCIYFKVNNQKVKLMTKVEVYINHFETERKYYYGQTLLDTNDKMITDWASRLC